MLSNDNKMPKKSVVKCQANTLKCQIKTKGKIRYVYWSSQKFGLNTIYIGYNNTDNIIMLHINMSSKDNKIQTKTQ